MRVQRFVQTKAPVQSKLCWGSYLAIVEDDGTDEPPSAAGHLAPVHQVLQLGDLH